MPKAPISTPTPIATITSIISSPPSSCTPCSGSYCCIRCPLSLTASGRSGGRIRSALPPCRYCVYRFYIFLPCSAPYRFIQVLLGVVFQCNWHTAVYTVQLDQLSSLIRKISCHTAAFTVDKCPFQILQVSLPAAFFTAVITKLMFCAESLCLTTVLTADM